MRTLTELAHILAGLLAATLITAAAMWAYPLGRVVSWWCGAAAMALILVLGAVAIRRAWAIDRRRR